VRKNERERPKNEKIIRKIIRKIKKPLKHGPELILTLRELHKQHKHAETRDTSPKSAS